MTLLPKFDAKLRKIYREVNSLVLDDIEAPDNILLLAGYLQYTWRRETEAERYEVEVEADDQGAFLTLCRMVRGDENNPWPYSLTKTPYDSGDLWDMLVEAGFKKEDTNDGS